MVTIRWHGIVGFNVPITAITGEYTQVLHCSFIDGTGTAKNGYESI